MGHIIRKVPLPRHQLFHQEFVGDDGLVGVLAVGLIESAGVFEGVEGLAASLTDTAKLAILRLLV